MALPPGSGNGRLPGMDLQETMRELESLGSEQTRKTFLRHGAPEPLFGVKFGDLEKLRKRIKTNAGLAEALWDTGNSEARLLATMVADAAAMSWEHLDAWARQLDWHTLVDTFVSNVAVHSTHARTALETWMSRSEEMQGRAGWQLLAALASKTTQLADEELARWLPRIEQDIHQAQNRVREAMNGALIAIGGRGGALQEQALEVAKRIGKVEVFHGDTACKTPDAVEYIEKIRSHKEGGAAKAAALAKNAVDSVKNLATGAAQRAAAGAQSVASGAMSAVAGAKNVVAGAQGVVSDVAKKAAANARNVVSGVTRRPLAGGRNGSDEATKKGPSARKSDGDGAAKKAAPSARKNGGDGAAKKAAPSAKKGGAAKKAPLSAKKNGATKKATPAPAVRKAVVRKAAVKKAAPAAAKGASAKKAAPAAAKKAPAKSAPPASAKKGAAPAKGKAGAKKGARPRA